MSPLDRAIVIAGPSCVGKSTLIDRLRHGELPALAAALQLGDPERWVYLTARRSARMAAVADAHGLVLHYDILRPLMERRVRSFGEDPGLVVALTSPQLCLCTMWGDADLLRRHAAIKCARRATEESIGVSAPVHWWMRNRRMRTIRARYRDDDYIHGRYEQWLRFARSIERPHEHLVVDASDAARAPVELRQWLGERPSAKARAAAG